MQVAEYSPSTPRMHEWGDEDATGEVSDDSPVAAPCEVPKLMDVESMRPRLQAINGPLNEAAFRGQLQEAHHPLHRTRALQNGNCCPQILCKVSDTQAGSPPQLAPHLHQLRKGRERAPHNVHDFPKATRTPNPQSYGLDV